MTRSEYYDDVKEISEIVSQISGSFLNWLTDEVSKRSVDIVLFVSRDGYWFFHYAKLPSSNFRSNVVIKYLLVSRASLQELMSKCKKGALKDTDLQYLRSSFLGMKSIGIVDLGWSGSSIEILQYLFPELKFTGFFFGTHRNTKDYIRSYLGRIRIRKYLGLTEILESIFSAPHHSIKRVKGTSDSPLPEYFSSDPKLLSLQRAIKLQLRDRESNERPIWSRGRVQLELTKLCMFPEDKVFKKLYEIGHSVKSETAEKLTLSQYRFPQIGTRALVPFWSLRAILISDQNLLYKVRSGTWFLFGQVKFMFSHLIKSVSKKITAVW